MTKRALVILAVAAVVLGGAAAVIASSISGSSSDEPVHTLPGGEVHTGEMPPTDTGGSASGDESMDGGAGSGGDSRHDTENMDGMKMGE